ncbi:MAG: NTP transferase domain-containing protein [Acidobacteria bacterium]|nr:NTP transferase domain-containing protein [Acidobacteriota bacterium]
MASTRFPGKPLAPIAGKPMLAHVWKAVAIRSKLIEPCYVATADREIITWCEFLGVKCLVTRADCQSGTERCHDAMRQLKNLPGDIVVNIQGDEPTIRGESLDELVRAFEDPEVEIASLCFAPTGPEFMENQDRVKVLIGGNGDALGFFRSVHSAHLWRSYRQHVGVYAYRREVLAEIAGLVPPGDLEQEAWMAAGHRVRMVETPYRTASVDSPNDIEKVEIALRARAGTMMVV